MNLYIVVSCGGFTSDFKGNDTENAVVLGFVAGTDVTDAQKRFEKRNKGIVEAHNDEATFYMLDKSEHGGFAYEFVDKD